MRTKLLTAAIGAAIAAMALPSHAEFALGEETSGVTIKLNDNSDMKIRARLQPRVDFGDLVKDAAGKFESESDFYIRRARLEVSGKLYKNLKYQLVLAGDKAGQASTGTTSNFNVLFANFDYKFSDAFDLRFGKAKLPYSRISLSSSSKQLLVERPASTEAAKKQFGDYDQTNLMVHGKFAEGIFKYNFAVADGSRNDTDNKTSLAAGDVNGNKVESDLAYIGRITFSPPGWVEKGMSDAHLGKGKHLAFGLHAGKQSGLKAIGGTTEVDRDLLGGDVSFHVGGFTAQAEYNKWSLAKTGVAADVEPKGYYLQAGYFIPGANIEPAIRFEEYDHNSNATTDKKDKITTLGFNWYFKGHSLKLGVNWARTKLGAGNVSPATGDDTNDLYQVQTQVYF